VQRWAVRLLLAPLVVALTMSGAAPAAGITLIPTDTTVTVPASPIALYAPIEFGASVSPDPGAGWVSFVVDDVFRGTGEVGGGPPTFTLPYGLGEGVHTIVARFQGNDTHAASDSPPKTVTVVDYRASVSVTIASTPNPSLRGDTVALHAVVTPNPQGGQVAFLEGSTQYAAKAVGLDGTVDAETWFSTSATHPLRACFYGNSEYKEACSSTIDQVVTSSPSTTTLTIEPGTIYPDESFTIGITVSPVPETATNAWVGVNEFQHSVWVGIDPVTGHGEVTLMEDLGRLRYPMGTNNLIAFFPGTNHVDASHSDVVSLTVRLDSATLEPSTSLGPTTVGDPLTFFATVTPAPSEPTAAVGFLVRGPPGSGFGDNVAIELGPDGTGQTTVNTAGWPAGDYWYDSGCCGDPHLAPIIVRGYFTLVDIDAPTGDVIVGDGSGVVIDDSVSVNVPATDGGGSGVTVVELSNDGATWTSMAYAAKVPWTLAPGDGIHTVHAKWQDQAGNWSQVVSETVDVESSAGTVSAPKIALVSGTTITSGRAAVRIAWTGATAGVGHVTYRLEQSTDGHAWSLSGSGLTTTSVTRYLLHGHGYRFRVRAVDPAGGLGPWAQQAASIRLTGYQQTSAAVTYRGTWTTSTPSGAWGGSLKGSSARGATAAFKFTGRGAALVARTGPTRGIATIWVNGVKVATVNLYSAAWHSQRVVWRATWSSSATRTVVVRVSGTAGRPRVEVDGFLALR
jgi:hypothetical protein